jgi:hypothetical protein
MAAGLDPDVTADERARLERQLADCADCRALASELATISAAVRSDLPQPARPRDFRLSADQAARLRGSPVSRLLERLGTPSFGALQPLAGVAMALGITLIVLNSVSLPFGASGAAPTALNGQDTFVSAEGAPGAASAAPSPDAAGAPLAPVPGAGSPGLSPAASRGAFSSGQTHRPMDAGGSQQPVPSPTTGAVLGPNDTSVTPQPTAADRVSAEPAADRQAESPAGLVAGTVLLVSGALLLVIRFVGRRRLEGAD